MPSAGLIRSLGALTGAGVGAVTMHRLVNRRRTSRKQRIAAMLGGAAIGAGIGYAAPSVHPGFRKKQIGTK